jgi:hypothetical protein
VSALLILLGIWAQTEATSPELVPTSRNSVVFIESAAAGSEWEAYRLADPEHPAIWKATGPARLLLKVRTYAGGDAAVGAILVDDRIVLTARVEAELDPDARATGESDPISVRHVYLVKVPAGVSRVTVRYSEGQSLLVSAALSPVSPLELIGTEEGELPIVPPVEHGKVQRTELALDEAAPVPRTLEPSALERGEAQKGSSSRTGPREEEVVLPARAAAGVRAERALTLPVPYLMLELRGGVRVSDLDVGPSPTVGLSARLPLPRLDPRRFTLGVAADLAVGLGDQEVRSSPSGPIIDVVEVAQTTVVIGVDFRWAFYSMESVTEVYGTGGVSAAFGSLSLTSDRRQDEALVVGALAQLRLGATLGTGAGRPYLELGAQFGRLGSDLIGSDGPSGAVTFLFGYRVELWTDVPVE